MSCALVSVLIPGSVLGCVSRILRFLTCICESRQRLVAQNTVGRGAVKTGFSGCARQTGAYEVSMPGSQTAPPDAAKVFTWTRLARRCAQKEIRMTTLDFIACSFFIVIWLLFVFLVEKSRWRDRCLSSQMNKHRAAWMQVMLQRDLRIVDTSIIAGLQQGTAYFSSVTMFAIGGCFALFGSAERVHNVFENLHLNSEESSYFWEAKVLGLALILSYAFFKFGWAYRLYHYCSIVMGAVPIASSQASEVGHENSELNSIAVQAANLNILAGRHFNAGLRGMFFSIGFLGWFAGPYVFMAATALIFAVLVRRQFFSQALKIVDGRENVASRPAR